MNSEQYRAYETSVSAFMERNGIQNLSTDMEADGETCEPFFSGRPCECCGTHLGGNRENVSGWNPTSKTALHFVVCSDCVYYAEYGRLDDETMMSVRASSTDEAE